MQGEGTSLEDLRMPSLGDFSGSSSERRRTRRKSRSTDLLARSFRMGQIRASVFSRRREAERTPGKHGSDGQALADQLQLATACGSAPVECTFSVMVTRRKSWESYVGRHRSASMFEGSLNPALSSSASRGYSTPPWQLERLRHARPRGSWRMQATPMRRGQLH